MAQTFAEYSDVEFSAPLRQGDVLEVVDAGSSETSDLLLVITADCDLAFNKNRDLVTCVPILPKEVYLLTLIAPRVRSQAMKQPVADFQSVLAQCGYAHVSDSRVRQWIAEADNNSIVAELSLEERQEVDARAALDAMRLIDSPRATIAEFVDALVEAQMKTKAPPKTEKARSRVLNELREPFARPPGDTLFLGCIAPGLEDGYFAYLRHPEQIEQSRVATTPGRHDVQYKRISRLQDRFTHAVVQRFAMVFMSIGLPSEYEEIRDLHATFLGEK